MSGNQVSVFNLPNHYMSGIAYDNDNYWVCTYYPDPGTVYLVNSAGGIITQFTPPANQPWDICTHGSDLWIADYNANTLYKVNTSGYILESHPCQNQKPSGIVYDGTYRWYLEITNTGNQPLQITDLQMSDNHFIVDEAIILPLTIQTLQTGKIGIWFHPTEGIDYDGTLSIISNAVGQSPFDVSLLGTGVETLYPAGTLLWSYTPPPYYDTSPKSMIAGDDITCDGVADVIIGSEDNFMRCLNGNSSVTADLMWEYEIPTGSVYQQHDMAMSGDINNDGYDDVIVGTAWGDRSITAFSGKTGISLWETPLNGPVFAVKGVEDFTGDGIPDAVAGASNMNETEGRMFGINGSNGAIAWTQYAVGSSVWAVLQIDDINGDNIKDVATGDYIGRVFLHDAVNGTKLFNANIAGSIILRFEDLGDVNNDMHRDFIVGHSGTNAIVISGKDASTIW